METARIKDSVAVLTRASSVGTLPPESEVLMDWNTVGMNVTTIAGEILALILVFVILNLILRRLFSALASAGGQRSRMVAERIRRNLRGLLMLAAILLSLGVAGLNGWWWYQGRFLPEYTLELVLGLPDSFWIDLGIGAAKVVAIGIAAAVVLRVVRRVLQTLCRRAKAWEGVRANDEAIDAFFSDLGRTLGRGTWIAFFAVSAALLQLPVGVSGSLFILLRVYLIVAVGFLAWRATEAVIESLEALSRKYRSETNLLRFYDRFSHLLPVFRSSVQYALYVVVASLAVSQVDAMAGLATWGPRLIRVIGAIFLGRVAASVVKLLAGEFLVNRPKLNPDQKQRRMTILPLIQTVLKTIVYFVVFVVVLQQFNIDVIPILAGAGILGLVIGLSAQTTISDSIGGFLILIENQYLVGDYVHTSAAEGFVEEIGLRTTRIRDGAGRVHYVRNGSIQDVVNFSKSYVYAVVEVGVAYESDLDTVNAAFARAGERISEESPDVTEPTEVLGLADFGESELRFRTITKVKPGQHLPVERALRRIIKEEFDRYGVEIPYARRVVIMKEEGEGEEQGEEPAPAIGVA
jgi:moderate conductance mechanosensitive channel